MKNSGCSVFLPKIFGKTFFDIFLVMIGVKMNKVLSDRSIFGKKCVHCFFSGAAWKSKIFTRKNDTFLIKYLKGVTKSPINCKDDFFPVLRMSHEASKVVAEKLPTAQKFRKTCYSKNGFFGRYLAVFSKNSKHTGISCITVS